MLPTALTFALTVTDPGGLSDTDTVHINVNPVTPPPVNKPPVANAGHPGPDQNVNAGSLVTLDGSASYDPDGNPLTYSWRQTDGPSVMLNSTTSRTVAFTAPSVSTNAATALTFALTVTDPGGLSDTDTVHINVNPVTPPPVNKPPVANAGHPGPDQNVNAGSLVTLDGSASYDPDGNSLTYSWRQTDGPSVMLNSTTSRTVAFTAPSVSTNAANSTYVCIDSYRPRWFK